MGIDYVDCAVKIAKFLWEVESEIEPRVNNVCAADLVRDAAVLQTMLERCNSSKNSQLKADLKKHDIPERLEKISNIVSRTHRHEWNEAECQQGSYTFARCIKESGRWNGTLLKTGQLAAGAFGGVLMLGIPLAITGYMVYAATSHANEMTKNLEFVVKETASLFRQVQGIMIANQVK